MSNGDGNEYNYYKCPCDKCVDRYNKDMCPNPCLRYEGYLHNTSGKGNAKYSKIESRNNSARKDK